MKCFRKYELKKNSIHFLGDSKIGILQESDEIKTDYFLACKMYNILCVFRNNYSPTKYTNYARPSDIFSNSPLNIILEDIITEIIFNS